MKRLLVLIGFVAISQIVPDRAIAQSYYGFQTITTQTYFFSVVWDGEPKMGFGYIYRNTIGGSFMDIQGEVRYPLKGMFQPESWDKFTAIAGIYAPNRIRRSWVGLGAHVRYKHNNGPTKHDIKLAISAIPSYTYVTSLTDGPYGTIGARFTYLTTVFDSETKKPFSTHSAELGFHTDMVLERNLGLALNIFKPISAEKNTLSGDFYFGPGF